MSAPGKPTGIKNSTIKTIETFASRFTIQEDGCWQWHGYINKNGYGQFLVKRIGKQAHRIMWELVGHTFTDPSLVIDHMCENRLCVNPKHLQEVSLNMNIKYSTSISTIAYFMDRCPSGHIYSLENTYINKKRNNRACKECSRISCLRYYYKTKGKK